MIYIFILPINYNLGWWKLANDRFEGGNGAHFSVDSTSDFYIYNNKIINFHFHIFQKNQHDFDRDTLTRIFVEMIQKRGRQEDQKTLEEISRLTNENI